MHRWQIVEVLLEAGADVNPSIGADAKCSNHYSPTDWNLDRPPPDLEETPLSCAIKERNEELARLLIDRGALVTPQTPPTTGTPLVYAAKEGMVELVRDLLSQGADAEQQGTFVSRGQPTLPIVLAAQVGNEEMIRLLINAGADPNGQDSEGFSALHKSAACSNPDVLKVLLEEYNGDISLRLLNGSRPIHSAASFGRVEQIKTLLDAGADIDGQNDDRRTPLHWAAEGGCWDAVELLLDRGAATDIRADCTAVTAQDLGQLARQESVWRIRRKNEGWDEKRIDGLMERLKPRAKIR
jgi:ankyrin repeat protein